MIEIINYKTDFHHTILLDQLTEYLTQVLKDFSHDSEDVNVVLCDNEFIRNLNRDYRGKDQPTDVLSFSQSEGEEMDDEDFDDGDFGEELQPLGDIIISVDKALEQASEYGVSIEEELARLSIHGMLHLLGFDHETSPDDEKVMFEKQDHYLNRFLEIYSH